MDNEYSTLKNDNFNHNENASAQAQERVIVEIADSMTVFPDGYTFERVFPEDPEFEERHRSFGLHRWYFASADGCPATKAVAELEDLPGIVRVEREAKAEPNSIPFNDPNRNLQWHLCNDGSLLAKFVEGADLNVVPVWNGFTAGNGDVIVGVIDSGIQYDHPDLSGVIVPAGPDGSKSFLESAAQNPYDITPQRHGTHVAGIIGAINNNGKGVCGIAGGKDGKGGVRILDCPAIAAIEGDSGNTAMAIVWAADHGAVILNNSWNFVYNSEGEVPSSPDFFTKTAIDYFVQNAGTDKNGNQTGPMKGGLVVFSAGNKAWSKSMPSMYENVLAVGAIGPAGENTSYTNYGDWVDLCAPGGNAGTYANSTYPQIYSTMAGSGYWQMQGTSQAAPAVSGVAALIVSQFGGPGFTNDRLREILIGGADREMMKKHSRYIGPMVDAYGSFMYAMDESLDAPSDVTGAQTPENALGISWTLKKFGSLNVYRSVVAVSDDPSKLQGLDPLNLPSGITVKTIDGSKYKVEEKITVPVDGLEFGRDYYYTVAGYTRNHTVSGWSAVGSARLRPNTPPELTSDYKREVALTHNDTKVFTLRYHDADGDELDIKLDPASTAGVWHDDGAGTITFTITGKDAPAGSYIARASISDGICTKSTYIIYTLTPNRDPVITQKGTVPQTLRYTEECSVTFSLSDADGDAVSVTCTNGSAAAEWQRNGISGYTLTIRGNGASAGTYTAAINASDSFGGSTEKQVEYTLLGNNAPILGTPLPDMAVAVGKDATVDLSAHFTDPEGDAVSYSLASAEGVTAIIEGSTLTISAAAPGTGSIRVSASDGMAESVSASFRISIHNAGAQVADIYPLTVSDKLTVQALSGTGLTISIYTSSGKKVFSESITADPFSPYVINTSGLAPGVYTIKVESSKEKTTKRIVKI